MNSLIRETPGPLVAVKALAPFQFAPMVIPIAANSSSAWIKANLFLSVPISTLSFSLYLLKDSAKEVDGVIGYQAQTVAPP